MTPAPRSTLETFALAAAAVFALTTAAPQFAAAYAQAFNTNLAAVASAPFELLSGTQGLAAAAGNAPMIGGTPVPQAIAPASAAACASISHTLARGSTDAATGGEVSRLQQALAGRGYLSSDLVTGYFGSLTQSALMRYQADRGIVSSGTAGTTGFGVAGPKTRAMLGCGSAPQAGGQSPTPTYVPPIDCPAGYYSNGSQCVAPALSASPSSGVVPFAVSFVAAHLRPGSYTVDFGDGTVIPATSPAGCTIDCSFVVVHTYTAVGMYRVNAANGAGIISTVVDVSAPAPTYVPPIDCPAGYYSNGSRCVSSNMALTATPASGTAPLEVEFDFVPSSTSAAYTMSFGDGATATVGGPCTGTLCPAPGTTLAAYHTYQSAGTYRASITDGNAIGSATVVVSAAPAPSAALSASPTSGTAPLGVTFSNVGSSLDYGDGSLGPSRSGGQKIGTVSHTYQSAGTYTATSDTGSVTITVVGTDQGAAAAMAQFVADYSDAFNQNLAAVVTAPFDLVTNALGDFFYSVMTGAQTAAAGNVPLVGGTPVPQVVPVATTNTATASCAALTRTLMAGSRGSDVSQLQQALGVTPTGYFGPLTQKALTNWQSGHGIDPVGIAGPKTRAALRCSGMGAPAAQATQPAQPVQPAQSQTATTYGTAAPSTAGGSYDVDAKMAPYYAGASSSTLQLLAGENFANFLYGWLAPSLLHGTTTGSSFSSAGYQGVSCANIASMSGLGVILVAGQSNAANYAQPDSNNRVYTSNEPVYDLNIEDGNCYIAKEPLLGADKAFDDANPSKPFESFALPLADQLIQSGAFKTVLIVPIAQGGTYIEQWNPSSNSLFTRFTRAFSDLKQIGLQPTFILWSQGESNGGWLLLQKAVGKNPGEATPFTMTPDIANAATLNWMRNFYQIVSGIRAQGVSAPIFPAVTTRCINPYDPNTGQPLGLPDPDIERAQQQVVDSSWGIYAGPNADALPASLMGPGPCHFTYEGNIAHAQAWYTVLKNYLDSQSGSATFSASPTSGQAPLSVRFVASGNNGTYRIDYGDGQNGTMSSGCATTGGACLPAYVATHTYQSAGMYTATASYAPACPSGSFCPMSLIQLGTVTVIVSAASQPTPTLSVSAASGAAPLSVTFTSNQAGTVVFGDGASAQLECAQTASVGSAPVCSTGHVYQTAGAYTAALTNNGNCPKGTACPVAQLASAPVYVGDFGVVANPASVSAGGSTALIVGGTLVGNCTLTGGEFGTTGTSFYETGRTFNTQLITQSTTYSVSCHAFNSATHAYDGDLVTHSATVSVN